MPDRACRACGCTDERGCAEGCWWIESDLCSSCGPDAPVSAIAAEIANFTGTMEVTHRRRQRWQRGPIARRPRATPSSRARGR